MEAQNAELIGALARSRSLAETHAQTLQELDDAFRRARDAEARESVSHAAARQMASRLETAEEDARSANARAQEAEAEAARIWAHAQRGEAEGQELALKAGQHLVLRTAEVERLAEERIRAAGEQANTNTQVLVHAVAQHASAAIARAVLDAGSSAGLAWQYATEAITHAENSYAHRVSNLEANTQRVIQEALSLVLHEQERSRIALGDMEAYTEESIRAVEERLTTALEEADAYLDQASEAIASQVAARGQLLEEFQEKLDGAQSCSNTLRQQMQVLEKKVDASRKKIARMPEQQECAIIHAVKAYAAEQASGGGGPTLNLKEKGVIPDPIRALVRDLVQLGLKVDQVNGAITAILGVAGTTVEGSFSERSVGRMVLEGGVAAQAQIAEAIASAESITVSNDGTTNRNVSFDSRHIHAHNGSTHTTYFMGVHSAPNHTSETQLAGWKGLSQQYFNTYNASPRGKANPQDPRSFPAKISGVLTDHTANQHLLSNILQDWKISMDRELRGEQALAGLTLGELLPVLAEETAAAVGRAGGANTWAQLAPEELEQYNHNLRRTIIKRLGEDAYQALPDTNKQLADLFVHAGCCMHKELNTVKGGNTRMMAYWKSAGLVPPLLLMNKANNLAAAGSSSSRERATASSCGGGVKLAELEGTLFNNKDDKKGQHDTMRYYFEAMVGKRVNFPDTSNTRYQSYCEAAGELLVHLPYYITFIEQIRDKKIKGTFTNLEQNIYNALADIPTLTELCALALYAQAVSHPYMREVRKPGTNHLDLGPLHAKVQAHCTAIIEDPDLLLASAASYTHGALDGALWERSAVFEAVCQLAPTLPHLRGVLVAFMEGALETWVRFAAEFAEGGTIARLTAQQRDQAWMPATNDRNEGALGVYRISARDSPNKSLHMHNAEKMYATNRTSAYIAEHYGPLENRSLRAEAREVDSSGLERKRRHELAEEDERAASKRRTQKQEKHAKEAARKKKISGITLIDDLSKLTMADMTVKLIDEQISWHRQYMDTVKDNKKIPMQKDLRTKESKLNALRAAVERYLALPPEERPGPIEGIEPEVPDELERAWWSEEEEEEEEDGDCS